MTLTDRNRKYLYFTAWLTVSILWLVSRIFIWNACGSYLSYTKPICQLIGLNRDLEWRRAVAVMCYFQGLPFGIAAYCLLVRFPARSKRSFALRCAVCASLALVSLVAFPPIAAWLFPSYKSPFSPNNPNYYKVLIITILVGIAAVLAAGVFLLTRLRKPTPAQITDTCAKVGITLVLSFLIASAYGLILGIVGTFAPDAERYVLRSFAPDANLVMGLLSMGVMAPLAEELILRGVILSKLRRHCNVWVAVILSSLIFAAWHRNLGQFFPTFFMGLGFSWIYLKTGKLRYAMLLHSASNYLTIQSLAGTNDLLPYIPALFNLQAWLRDLPIFWALVLLAVSLAGVILLIRNVLPKFCKNP